MLRNLVLTTLTLCLVSSGFAQDKPQPDDGLKDLEKAIKFAEERRRSRKQTQTSSVPTEAGTAQSKTYDLESPLLHKRSRDGEVVGLYTPISRWERPHDNGVQTLDFIGAVHYGDTKYYEFINLLSQNYQKFYYELVAPDNQLVPEDRNGALAQVAKMVLGLDSQLAVVDYSQDNFVHADWTHSEAREALMKNGDTPLTVGLDVWLNVMRQQNKMMYEMQKDEEEGRDPDPEIVPPQMLKLMDKAQTLDIDPLALLLGDQNQAVKIKRLMAEQFEMLNYFSFGPVGDDYLINQRNNDALREVDKGVEDGVKTMALFYGAAHLPDFAEKLQARGWQYKGTRWIPAWDKLVVQRTDTQDLQGIQTLLRQLQQLQR